MIQLVTKKFTQTQLIAGGFLLIILVGTLLLMLPIASRTNQITPFVDALFTATSAACVTGLVVHDTYQYWSLFGQFVILLLIQIGGLGFMTIGVFFSMLLRRKIGLRTRGILQESINTLQIGGIVRLAKHIIIGTLIFEGVGAVILSLRFIPIYGYLEGIYYGVFHAISAFCNAGFDLMGQTEAYSSLLLYANDWIVNLTLIALIVIGGIGFLVWEDCWKHKLCFRQYHLHTKIVLITTLGLIVSGTLLYLIMEANYLFANQPFKDSFLQALFSSVTARTAGFNTVSTDQLQGSSKMLTMILMFIGGSPGSTAGGIKTTTVVVLAVYLIANIRHTSSYNIFDRRIDSEAIKKASAVLCTNLFLSMAVILFISTIQSIDLTAICFEVFSAIGTVGMSCGITRDLSAISRLAIIFLMYCGRIGSLSFALSLKGNRSQPPVILPVEQVTIG